MTSPTSAGTQRASVVTAPARADAVDPAIRERLTGVYDPCCREKGISVVDMGLLHRAHVDDAGRARVELLLTSGWCPFASTVLTEIEAAVAAMPGVRQADVEIVWDEAWSTERLAPSAREKLRFLPPPTRVGDRTAYVEKHWTTGEPATKEH
jgi:metal-sulfur cluster biosynthetic enzyme